MKAVVAAFNQEKALVGAFSVITNLRMELFQALMRNVFLSSSTEGDRCGVGDNYRYWCGFTDLGREDVWTDVNWRNQLSYYRDDHPWNRGEPNGGKFENCAENEIR